MRDDRKTGDIATKLGVFVEALADWAVRIGLLVILLVIAYVLVGVLSGQMLNLAGPDLERVTHNVKTATEYMMIASLVVCLVLVFRQKENTQDLYGFIVLGGLLAWFGFPLLVNLMKGHVVYENDAVRVAVRNFARSGQVVLVTLAWPMLQVIWRYIKLRPMRKATDEYQQQSGLRRDKPPDRPRLKPTFLSPCWHLPYCRDYLVARCPAFIAKRRCWKFGGGCFCDQSMIEAMLTGMPGRPQKSGQAYMRAELEARNSVMRQRKGRTPCKQCFIYLEHEKLKYDVMNVLCYPATFAAIYFGYAPIIRRFWFGINDILQGLWQTLAFHRAAESENLNQAFGVETVALMFAVLIGMWMLLGLLRLCELWCFKWKL